MIIFASQTSPFRLCFHFSFHHNGLLSKTTRNLPRVTTQRCCHWQRGMAVAKANANAAMRCTKAPEKANLPMLASTLAWALRTFRAGCFSRDQQLQPSRAFLQSREQRKQKLKRNLTRRESSGGMEWLGVWNCNFSGSEFSNFGA